MTLEISEIGIRLNIGNSTPAADDAPAADDTAAPTPDEIETLIRNDEREVAESLDRLDDR